jgi:hypothetical protein
MGHTTGSGTPTYSQAVQRPAFDRVTHESDLTPQNWSKFGLRVTKLLDQSSTGPRLT